jgi:HEAT repeat protein
MKTLIRTIALVLTLSLAPAVVAQQSPTDGDQRQDASGDSSPVPIPFDGSEAQMERAKLLLSGYHGVAPKELFVETLDDPRSLLWALANHDGHPMYQKRALTALSYWPDARLYSLYVRLLRDDDTADTLRHRLILLLGEHFPNQALDELVVYLNHDDLQLRLSAIEAIRRIPSKDAVAALVAALETETNAVAKERLEQYTQVAR